MNNNDVIIYNNDENRDISQLFGIRQATLPEETMMKHN